MEIKEFKLPAGWVVSEVKDKNTIIMEEDLALPKSLEEIPTHLKLKLSYLAVGDTAVPADTRDALAALNHLLVMRNIWWKILDWKPDWEKPDEKCCIVYKGSDVCVQQKTFESTILAFPTRNIRNQFLGAFGGLIEEAKSLI